jgi:hypothetical protein
VLIIVQKVKKLAELLPASIPVDGVWPHGHRTCMHLLRDSSLNTLTLSKLAPPLGLPEPLPAVCRIRLRALSAQQFHGTAIGNVHGLLLCSGHCAFNTGKEKTTLLTLSQLRMQQNKVSGSNVASGAAHRGRYEITRIC